MNHPFMADAARALAARAQACNAATVEPRGGIRRLFLLAYQRPPTSEEADAVARFLSAPAEPLSSAVEASPPAQAWRYGTGTLDRSLRRVLDFQEFGYWTGEHWQPGPSSRRAVRTAPAHSHRRPAGHHARSCGDPALDRTLGRGRGHLGHAPPR